MVTINELREICSKKDKRPFYEVHVMREISFIFTKYIFLPLNMTANQITFLATIAGLLSSFFFMFIEIKAYFILAALLFQLWYILDMIDGNIARYTNTNSSLGLYYDRLHHVLVESLFWIGIGVGTYFFFNNINLIFFGVMAGFSYMLFKATISEKFRVYHEHNLRRELIKQERVLSKRSLFNLIIGLLKGVFDKSGFMFRHPFIMNIVLITSFIYLLFNLNLINFVLYFYGITLPFIALGSLFFESQIRFRRLE